MTGSIGDHGYDPVFQGYTLSRPVSPEDLVVGIAVLDAACAPLPREAILKELAALRVRTKARPEDAADLRFALQVYADDLASYPGDIVPIALRQQAAASLWWPSWNELHDRLEDMSRGRLALRDALRRAPTSSEPAEPRPSYERTPEQLAAADALMAKLRASLNETADRMKL